LRFLCMSQPKVINKRDVTQDPMFSPWYFVPEMPYLCLLVSTCAVRTCVALGGIGLALVDLLLGANSWAREDSLPCPFRSLEVSPRHLLPVPISLPRHCLLHLGFESCLRPHPHFHGFNPSRDSVKMTVGFSAAVQHLM